MALLILALLQRIFLMSSLMLLLVWLIFFMEIGRAVQQECRDRKSGSAGMPRPISYAVFCLKKKKTTRIGSNTQKGSEVTSEVIAPTSAYSSTHTESASTTCRHCE